MSVRPPEASNLRERTRFAAFEHDGPDLPTPRAPNATKRPAAEPADSSGPGWLGWLTAAAWSGIAAGAPIAYWGAGPLFAQHPAFLAALTAIILFPSAALLFGATAARDAAAARREAARAQMRPSREADEEQAAWRETLQLAQRNARAIAETLAHQRAEAAAGVEALKTDMEEMAGAVGRQIRLMREASRLVSQEAAAAESVFAEGLDIFADAAGDANRAAAALREATETAQSAQSMLKETVEAASDAAATVRDVSRAALTDARRTAQAIREEAEAARATMHDALAELQRNAVEARAAAEAAWSPPPARMPRSEQSAPRPIRAETPPRPAPAPARASSEDLHLDWMSPRRHDAVALLERLGVPPRAAIADSQFAQIARRARLGATARRRAVAEAAGPALQHLAEAMSRSEDTRRVAREFLRAPGFDADGPVDSWAGSDDVTRAYLLVDAALG